MRRWGEVGRVVGWCWIVAGIGAACRGAEPAPGDRPLILAHAMPWFEADAARESWGWHWTMNHFDPRRLVGPDRRAIAAHSYPAIGPYDSLDPAVLEYQTLLMKVAGIDGAIIDWYGTTDANDYARIHARALALVAALKGRGLRFAICYEDRAVRAIAARDKLGPDAAVALAASHLRFAADAWFRDPAYVPWGGKPLLLVFGPEFIEPARWDAVLRGLDPAPSFFTIHEPKGPAVGSFAWPPMWAARDGKLAAADLAAYLDRFARQGGARIPCAFPGFRDIYAEAGAQPALGVLDARDGATFRDTLAWSLRQGSPVVQVATWNDYGEGTGIEPTREAGARDLAAIQEARRRAGGRTFPYRAADLKLPERVFRLRPAVAGSADARRRLDAAVAALDAGNPARAEAEVARLEATSAPRARPR